MPPYQRCGEIVWKWKRQARTLAFQCIFCQDSRTTTLKDFKLHLDTQHPEFFPKEKPKQKPQQEQGQEKEKEVDKNPLLEQRTIRGRDEEPVTSAKEEDPLATQIIEQIKTEESSQEEFLSATDSESQGDQEEDTLLEWPESDGQAQTATKITDLSPFWMLEHPIMLAFINQLEQKPELWDVDMVSYRKSWRRNKAYAKIANGLNDQFELKLTAQEIISYVNQLKDAYAWEKKRLEQFTEPTASPKWYYERLHFLAKSLRQDRYAEALTVPFLNHAQNLQLIELYRQCSACWDKQDISCRLRRVRQAAEDRLLELSRSELEIPLEPSQLQNFIRRLRSTYHKEKARQLKCEREGKEFCPRSRYYEKLQFLEQHMAPLQCDVCQMVMNSVDGYRIHRANHDYSQPFACPTCGKGFYNIASCKSHLRRHTKEYRVSCEYCGKRFVHKSDLKIHRRSHTGERPYSCHICGVRFSTTTILKGHQRRHEQRPVAKCHICGKGFFERSALRDHINGHLNVRDKECDVCHKLFTSARYLRRHKDIHAEHKQYQCKICGKAFAQYEPMRAHRKAHDRKRTKEQAEQDPQ
ncbi:zinc finger protein 431-like [Drosophila elegans]|uniref:zinc finger protein 431-like n=1 Tax=Drosophila elegans TaxID=30023 RepID=UPI0007E854EC|nr:zinc finger protein 431-like [Drosophila elegans]